MSNATYHFDHLCTSEQYWCNVQSNESWARVPPFLFTYGIVISAIMVVGGVFCNGTILCMIVLSTSLRNRKYIYLFTSSLFATLVCLLVLPSSLSALVSLRISNSTCSFAGKMYVAFCWYHTLNCCTMIFYQVIYLSHKTLHTLLLTLPVQFGVVFSQLLYSLMWTQFDQVAYGFKIYGWNYHVTSCFINSHELQKVYFSTNVRLERWPLQLAEWVATIYLAGLSLLLPVAALFAYKARQHKIHTTSIGPTALVNAGSKQPGAVERGSIDQILIAILNLLVLGPVYLMAIFSEHSQTATMINTIIFYLSYMNILSTALCPLLANNEFLRKWRWFFGCKDPLPIAFTQSGRGKSHTLFIKDWLQQMLIVTSDNMQLSNTTPEKGAGKT